MTRPGPDVSIVIPAYRDGTRAKSAVKSILAQTVPDTARMEVIVVDDGSEDDTAEILAGLPAEFLRLIVLPRNVGRSAARNAGAKEARGRLLVFMDCDCLPVDRNFVAAHMEALSQGYVASTGHVHGAGGEFWGRYQSEASLRRERQHGSGSSFSGSSQNLAVSKRAFDQVGGFDTDYQYYGFEDRDLLVRLRAIGGIAWTPGAVVHHLDALDLAEVCRKMAEAGQYSAGQFAVRHPAAYRALGYAAIDAREHAWLRPLGRYLGPNVLSIAAWIEPTFGKPWMPYFLCKVIVKALTALSFLHGTVRASEPIDT